MSGAIGALLPLAAVLAAAAVVLYARLHLRWSRTGEPRGVLLSPLHRTARFVCYLQTAILVITAAILLNGILTHRFEFEYIFGHSSTDLPFVYLCSTFWAGQEGTFLLWALYGACFGCALIARSREWEPTVLMVWNVIQLLVLGLLLVHSPFAPLDLEHFSPADRRIFADLFAGVPPEGQGLNPLLQNPWMAIHPPILFLGFCAMGLPFCFAVAALLRGELDDWCWRAQSWTLLAWSVLGTGLILGGYWAYETLGWGGYWAWDPVENSSLVPWLFAGALFHGLILQQRSRGALRRLNLVLAALAFVAVSYGSFLNRSGVLSDFSVHSFVQLSAAFNRALMIFAAAPAVIFLLVWFCRRRTIEVQPLVAETLSRQQMLHGVTLLLGGSGLLVLIGNSWPLLSGVMSRTPGLRQIVAETASLQPSFYNQTHTPLAMVLAALLSVALLTGWDTVRREKLLAELRWPLALAGVVALVTSAALYTFLRHRAATPDWMPATAGKLALAWGTLLVLCSLAAMVNGKLLWREWRGGDRLAIGAHLAHTGFMILVIGIVVSSVYETKTILPLPKGETVPFGGYQLTYGGLNPVGRTAELRISARHGRRVREIRPLLRPGNNDEIIRNPGILKTWSHDLYLEPGEVQMSQTPEEVILDRFAPATIGDLTIEFKGFDLGDRALSPDDFRVGIELKVTRGETTVTLKPVFAVVGGKFAPEPAELPGGGTVTVIDMPAKENGGGDRVMVLSLTGAGVGAKPETAVMQVTLKPFMAVVWLGCWLLIAGGSLAACRRGLLARQRRERR